MVSRVTKIQSDAGVLIQAQTASTGQGGKTVRVRWVIVNKGTKENPVIKARLVAMDFARSILISHVASQGISDAYKIMILDVKSAFLYRDTKREIYIELPDEDLIGHSGFHVGQLLKAMYGGKK
jgi:hypothetical protein